MATKNKDTEQSYSGEPLLFSPGDIVTDKRYKDSIMQIVGYDYECTYKVYNYELKVIRYGENNEKFRKAMKENPGIICQAQIETAHEFFETVSDPVVRTLFGDNT